MLYNYIYTQKYTQINKAKISLRIFLKEININIYIYKPAFSGVTYLIGEQGNFASGDNEFLSSNASWKAPESIVVLHKVLAPELSHRLFQQVEQIFTQLRDLTKMDIS